MNSNNSNERSRSQYGYWSQHGTQPGPHYGQQSRRYPTAWSVQLADGSLPEGLPALIGEGSVPGRPQPQSDLEGSMGGLSLEGGGRYQGYFPREQRHPYVDQQYHSPIYHSCSNVGDNGMYTFVDAEGPNVSVNYQREQYLHPSFQNLSSIREQNGNYVVRSGSVDNHRNQQQDQYEPEEGSGDNPLYAELPGQTQIPDENSSVPCVYCGEIFTGPHAKGNLHRHRKTASKCPGNTSNSSYECPHCPGKAYQRTDGLRNHLRKKHGVADS